jgi:hypothetical protein
VRERHHDVASAAAELAKAVGFEDAADLGARAPERTRSLATHEVEPGDEDLAVHALFDLAGAGALQD